MEAVPGLGLGLGLGHVVPLFQDMVSNEFVDAVAQGLKSLKTM